MIFEKQKIITFESVEILDYIYQFLCWNKAVDSEISYDKYVHHKWISIVSRVQIENIL